jgi:hypothetical protein
MRKWGVQLYEGDAVGYDRGYTVRQISLSVRSERMKGLLGSVGFAVVALLAAAGCSTPMITVVSLENSAIADTAAATQPLSRTVPAPQKGNYQLFSSKQPKTPIYQTDLKKGDEVGFRVRGDRARGIAKGTIIELDDYADGASYSWKIEEKKKE